MEVLNLTNTEYFKLALSKGLCRKIGWYFDTMTLKTCNGKVVGKTTDSVKVEGNRYVCFINPGQEDEIKINITNVTIDRPLLVSKDQLILRPGEIANVTEQVETTVGRVITNYVLLANNFGNKIPYVNKKTSVGDLESVIAKSLAAGTIEVKEYINFVDSCSFLQNMSKIVTIAATPKNIKAPEGLREFKENLTKEFNKEYGDDWKKDSVKVGIYMERLKDYDTEYLKDDPTLGKIITKKIKTNARAKMHLGFGMEGGMNNKKTFVEESLEDGYPRDNEKLASIMDGSRSGSYNRGHETQEGGTVAKIMLRISNTLKIKKGDCGSKIFYKINVTKDNFNSLRGLWMKSGSGIVNIVEPEKLVGQEIEIRTPIFCKSPGSTFCGVCVGKNLENRETGLNLVLTDISATILTSSLKKMHNSQLVTGKFGMQDILR